MVFLMSSVCTYIYEINERIANTKKDFLVYAMRCPKVVWW
jgi:hypothetical protein